MSAYEIYQTIQSRPHGSSGRGMSYWEQAATCGRRVNLAEQYQAKLKQHEAEQAPEDGDDSLTIGTYYHALMELGLRGQTTAETWDQTDSGYDENFLEAVRLYRGYIAAWGSSLERWGADLVGVETGLSTADGQRTGRADAIFHIKNEAVVYENTGLAVVPGVYLMDWKTGKAKSERDQWEYGFGNQAINYIGLARRQYPELDIKGMIFDKIIRHKFLRKEPELASTGKIRGDKSFHAYVAQYQDGDDAVVENLIRIGKRNVESNEANSGNCFKGFKPCPFFVMGLCDRK